MAGTLLDARKRLLERQKTWEKVQDYHISNRNFALLKKAHHSRPVHPETLQKMIVSARRPGRPTWRDIVFYIVFEREIPLAELLPEIRAKIDRQERDFAYCCESKRKMLERYG